LAFAFNPFYQRRLKKSGKRGSAAAQTLVVTLLASIIPLLLILTLTGLQVNRTVRSINTSGNSVNVTKLTQDGIDKANRLLAQTPSSFRVTHAWIKTTEKKAASAISSYLQRNLASYVGSFFSFFTTAIIFIFVFLSLLKNQIKLRELLRDLNPMGPKMSDLYASKVSAMTKGMVRGQFVIAIAQGFVDAALVYLGGFHTAFFFFFLLLSVLSFIPLGGGIVAIPIGVIMLLSGNIAGGILVIAGHLVIVTNIDNVLRPRLVPKEAKLDSALVILSVFAGISLLGFLGIIVGPVIMILIVTTIEVYQQVYRGAPTLEQVPAKIKK
jgi:predicted PurR-regulated permease PerM